jgi:enolase
MSTMGLVRNSPVPRLLCEVVDEVSAFRVTVVQALEILDSRGRPTVQVTVSLADGTRVVAAVPSGASTGTREAVERRDGDLSRYGGLGVTAAVAAVNGEINDLLAGSAGWASLADVDAALIELDGTATKSRLGANAIVGVSMACARAFARQAGVPLWRWLSVDGVPLRLPVPHFNVINGGAHAANRLDFQEFMIAPLGAMSYAEALRAGAQVYAALRKILTGRGQGVGLGDEGGFAPDVTETEALDLLVAAIGAAGYTPGRDGVAIALDPAASGFYQDGRYTVGGRSYTTSQMIDWYAELTDRYPIWSIEDGLAEDDWSGWTAMVDRLGERIQIVGDDLLVTDAATIEKAAELGAITAALIKPNQVGTVTETLAAISAARTAGFGQMISHRLGETSDVFIADLAVGCGCGQLKSGAPARGERVAKYNRLLEIAHLEPGLAYGPPQGRWR